MKTFTDRHERDETLTEILRMASRTVDFYSPEIDSAALRSTEVCDALARLITLNPRNRIRILMAEDRDFLHHFSRLVNLCRKFPSYISIHKLNDATLRRDDGFLIADKKHLWVQPKSAVYKGMMVLDTLGKSRVYGSQFKELWQHSDPLPGISSTGL